MLSSVTAHASLLWLTLFFCPLTETFKPLISRGSLTHRDITQRAIFRKTGQVCRAMAAAQGQDFTLPVRDQWDHVTHLLETDRVRDALYVQSKLPDLHGNQCNIHRFKKKKTLGSKIGDIQNQITIINWQTFNCITESYQCDETQYKNRPVFLFIFFFCEAHCVTS